MKDQIIHIDVHGTKRYYSDKEMKILHREDGPACVYGSDTESLPISKIWYKNGKLHREDGHAVEYVDGTKEWWLDDKLHREDGPAIEYVNGTKEWWLNGKELSEEEFNERMKQQ